METTTQNTSIQYDKVVLDVRNIFLNEIKDTCIAFQVLQISSQTDIVFTQLTRIREREIQENDLKSKQNKNLFERIFIQAVKALIIVENIQTQLDTSTVTSLFDEKVKKAKELMENKNHDYGEAWRIMRTSSLTDLMLMKAMRIQQILLNDGKTLASEGVDANYHDIINYSVFAVIKIDEELML